MKTQNTTAIEKRNHGRPALCACLLALAVAAGALLSGCAGVNLWGEKSSGAPGSMGGSMSIPLGKKH